MRVDIYSHHFAISEIEPKHDHVISKLGRPTIEYETIRDDQGGMKKVRKRSFSFYNAERDVFRFHITLWTEFEQLVKIHPDLKRDVDYHHHRYTLDQATDAQFDLRFIHEPRDYQQRLIDITTQNDESNFLINLQAGGGKTLIAMHVMRIFKKRGMCVMRGGYLDRWIPDLDATFQLKGGRLLRVSGQKDWINLLEAQYHGDLDVDLIVVSIDTLTSYIADYYNHPELRSRYPFAPEAVFEKLGIGLVVLDEGHQAPYKVMRIFCHCNVPKFLTLSATVTTRDPFTNRIYEIMYPHHQRHTGDYRNVYIGVNALHYKLTTLKNLRTTGYMGAYSHVNFEQSLLRGNNRKRLASYLGLVKYAFDLKFVKGYLPGCKCLLFFATVNLCDKVVKYLQEKYPQFKVGRYTAKDKMSVLEDCDVIVSTVLSAGTAVDIVNLKTTLMTTAIDSQISNEQSLYRTRPVKAYPDMTPEFCYFVCDDIPKHLAYHRNKQTAFKGLVKYHNDVYLPYAT